MFKEARHTSCTVLFLLTVMILLFPCCGAAQQKQAGAKAFFKANDPNIQYNGRIDFTNPQQPRFGNPAYTLPFVLPEQPLPLS